MFLVYMYADFFLSCFLLATELLSCPYHKNYVKVTNGHEAIVPYLIGAPVTLISVSPQVLLLIHPAVFLSS